LPRAGPCSLPCLLTPSLTLYPVSHLRLPQTEQRFAELTALGLNVQIVAVGKKAQGYFKRRPKFNVVSKWPIACLLLLLLLAALPRAPSSPPCSAREPFLAPCSCLRACVCVRAHVCVRVHVCVCEASSLRLY